MTIGELFINLVIKGGEKAGRTIGAVNKSVEDLRSNSLAAKAAIVGMVYGFERLTGFASQIGMDLYKFGVTTGLSTRELQKWQYAANRFDVAGDEMAQTIRGIQQAVADMRLGKGAPEAMGLVGIDTKRADDTFYVLEKLQEFAKKQRPDIASNLLKSFGISDNVFQMLKSMDMKKDMIKSEDIISNGEIMKLVRINKEWKDFWFTLKTMGTKLVASDEFGQMFKALADGVFYLLGAGKDIVKFIKDLGLLKETLIGIGLALGAIFAPVTTAIAAIVAGIHELKNLWEGKEMFGGLVGADTIRKFKEMVGKPGERLAGLLNSPVDAGLRQAGFAVQTAGGGDSSVKMINTFHVSGDVDKDAARTMSKDFERTARQLPARRR